MNFTLHFTSFFGAFGDLDACINASVLMNGSVSQEQTTECVAYKWMGRLDCLWAMSGPRATKQCGSHKRVLPKVGHRTQHIAVIRLGLKPDNTS